MDSSTPPATKADKLVQRAHEAIDRLETEVHRLEEAGKMIRGLIDKDRGVNGANGEDHRSGDDDAALAP